MSEKRYFRTNLEHYLWFIWDGENMLYTSDPELPLEEWNNDYDGKDWNPDTLNICQPSGEMQAEDDPLFAYETDENWERL